jgi:signal transduction histidine kinase
LVEDEGASDAGSSRLKLAKAITNAEGRDAVTKAVDAYMAEHELPDDIELLAKLLEHRDESVQLEGMRQMKLAVQHERPRRTRGIIGQLKLIRDVTDDDEARELADGTDHRSGRIAARADRAARSVASPDAMGEHRRHDAHPAPA